ncbi:uncharacterized protein LOC115672306 isoform X2 [Syzygium oleosum]|nr:uncharacterized protein LOC115672306 isoform X2 [Syzygium oleosum]XP_030449947.1 uncharacterized protein LOC115672306 isoform X2 [Syzygium oleosum]XP_056172467.1 uncharacterized protein LOC115672306 isoform X2 [Syzygium oleosum]
MEAQRLSVDSESVTSENLVNELGTAFDGCLRIQNAHECESSSNGVDLSDDEDADELEEYRRSDQKNLDNVIRPSPSKLMSPRISSDEEDEEERPNLELQELCSEEVVDNAVGCSVSSPAPLELVSAFKGSREKQGGAPGKLTVTWAPDVYDPRPTQLLDIVTRGTKQKKVPKKEKVGVKEGQRGKETTRGAGGGRDSLRGGSSSKDKRKKQNHRTGKSGRSYSFVDDNGSDNYSY